MIPAFSFDSYRRTVMPVYLHVFLNSALYAGVTTILCVLIGYPVAYYIGRAPEASRDRLLMALMIPFLTSFLIRTFAWTTILDQHGVLNTVLRMLHIIPNVLSENFEILTTKWAVLIALVYTYLPFMILPIYGSVEKLDPSLIEAASDLGANPEATFIRVILPLTMPGVWAGADGLCPGCCDVCRHACHERRHHSSHRRRDPGPVQHRRQHSLRLRAGNDPADRIHCDVLPVHPKKRWSSSRCACIRNQGSVQGF